MKLSLLLVLLVSLVGCGTPPPAPVVHIDSDPAGARVFFGQGANESFGSAKDYIGTTPFDWLPPHNGHNEFQITGALVYSIFVAPAVVVEAQPPAGSTNLFPQRVVFHGGTIAWGADKIPKGIMFDMTKPMPPEKKAK